MAPNRLDLRLSRLLGTLWLATALAWPAFAQEPAPSAAEADPTTAEALTQRFDATQVELEELKAQIAAQAEPKPQLQKRLEVLTSISNSLSREIEERRALDAPSETAAEREAGAAGDAPTSMAALIELFEERDRNRQRLRDLTEATKAGRAALGAAEEALQAAERTRREARQTDKDHPTPETAARLQSAKLQSRAAQEQVYLRELEHRGDRAALAHAEQRAPEIEQDIARITEAIRADPNADSEPDSQRIAAEGEAMRRRESAERDLASSELQLANAVAQYQSRGSSDPSLLEQVETLRLSRDANAQKLSALEAQLTRAQEEREIEKLWLATIRGDAPKSDIDAWSDQARDAALANQRAAIQLQGRIAELQERLDEIRARRDDTDVPPELSHLLQQRRNTLRELVAFLTADANDLERHTALQQQFLGALRDASGATQLWDQLKSFGSTVAGFWNAEITTVDDEAITVGNAFLALVLIALGFTISGRASRGVRHLFESRLELEPGVAGAVQTALFYVLLVSFVLIALRTINFPLTAFTVAGGALAIGIGFGSQNVMNNFISGLILMLERPVRSHDLVEVESTHGTIEQIGARSTRIRATDGRHIIVPNSFFLENNVVNWTLSDDLIRAKVSVGVAYGSPTRLVRDLIQQALSDNEKILPKPAPVIVFSDFGDNSLNFDSHFWLKARGPMQVNQVASELRFRIDDLFRENGIVIAFPQRDVHLDSLSPIEVRVIDTDDSTPAS